MQDYERTQATLRLMSELAKGRRSGEQEGWLTSDDLRDYLRVLLGDKAEGGTAQ